MIGACGNRDGIGVTVVAIVVSWVEVSDDAVFADVEVSGFIGVLADSLQGAVSVVFDYDGDVVHSAAFPKRHVTVGWRVVG